MRERGYVREGVVGWPVERQIEVLAEAGITGPLYHDTMSRADKRGRRTSALVEREAMLRPTSRQAPEIIVVATIRALALNFGPDLLGTLKAAGERHATVRALAEGLEIPPGASIGVITTAALAWDKGRRDDQTVDARTKGAAAAAARAAERRAKAIAIAQPLWGLPSEEMPSAEIERRAGISITTLYRELGRRTPAQRRAKRKERNHA